MIIHIIKKIIQKITVYFLRGFYENVCTVYWYDKLIMKRFLRNYANRAVAYCRVWNKNKNKIKIFTRAQ